MPAKRPTAWPEPHRSSGAGAERALDLSGLCVSGRRGRKTVRKGASLYRAGEPFSVLYLIHSGTFKTLLVAADGREQVGGFHLRGDVIGADGLAGTYYLCDAVALEYSEVWVLRPEELDGINSDWPVPRRSIALALARKITRVQATLLLLGSMHAEERVAAFLLDLASRYHALGYSGSEIVLRMTRAEIGSYLGLKIETISRMLSRFQRQGLLQVQGRVIKLLDPPRLRQLAAEAPVIP